MTEVLASRVWVCPQCDEVHDLLKMDPDDVLRDDCSVCRMQVVG